MNEFLEKRYFMRERLELGIDVHPSDDEAREFQRLAKEIDPQRYFTLYGCQSCINSLVKFVFDNAGKLEDKLDGKVKKVTFPKQ